MIGTQRERNRWYDLIDTPEQRALVDDDVRFKVAAAGRRSGKTERAKRKIVKEAMQTVGDYFISAPTHQQVKRIYWEDIKLLSFASMHLRRPSETELTVYIPNGSTITLIGLDKPQRIEGKIWHGGIGDEFADSKPDAWTMNISPALDTVHPERPEYRAWMWIIGVPEGLNHFYDLAEYAKGSDPDWKYYTWKSSDILPPEVIDAAKRRMSAKQFQQEYEASFETASGRIYDDYCELNTTDLEIAPHEQLLWMHDFNYTPLSSAIGVMREGMICILDEIILESAVARQTGMEFVERYKDHENKNVIIYGDPSGRAGEKHGQKSNYIEIESVLREAGWKYTRRVKKKAPAIRDRQNAVRAKIQNAAGEISLFVNPAKALYAHKGLSTVQFKKGSAFLEEETDFQHITTGIGYFIDYEFPISGGGHQVAIQGI